MAKRTPRSQANDAAPGEAQAQPQAPRKTARPRRSVATAARPELSDLPAMSAAADLQSTPEELKDEEIRHRAYMRYLERGGDHGADFDDWLQAELELKKL